ncbi:hypothetical protein LJR219_001473 [Phenylobacterium sp. LjRoot219]|uniref:hypothetical protein n=1 Tax=Phenylobacterium sp. LjRoot219 TaxID=3342283 RepID=UPI003ECDD0C3
MLARPDIPAAAPRLQSLGLSPDRPLVVVDVDEVLGLFIKGFAEFLAREGLDFRLDRYALFQNIYAPGAAEPIAEAQAKALYQSYFRSHCGALEPAPGAIAALEKLHRAAEIVILSNAPAEAETLRRGWLTRHGLAHPLILNRGPKGPMTAGLVRQSRGRSAFIDDILENLDSVAEHAPQTATFQHVADERLRPLAPRSARHRRIDDWAELGLAVEEAVRG